MGPDWDRTHDPWICSQTPTALRGPVVSFMDIGIVKLCHNDIKYGNHGNYLQISSVYFSLEPFLGYDLALCGEHQSLINFRFVQMRTLS